MVRRPGGLRFGARLACLLLLCMSAPVLRAQHYAFRFFGRESGLTNLEVQSIDQDRTGYLWIGTRNGLFRYDGTRFDRFGPEDGLPSEVVEGVAETSDGSLWVATTLGLARRSGTRFVPVQLGFPYRMYGPGSLAKSRDGRLYFSTDQGLVVGTLAAGRWSFERVRGPDDTASRSAFGVYAAPDGRIWYGCGKRLCVYDGSRTFEPPAQAGLPEALWLSIGAAPDGRIWLRSYDHLYYVDSDGRRARVAEQSPAHSEFRAAAPAIDHSGRFLIPTLDGLAIRQKESEEYVSSAQGLLSDSITAVFEDREGSLWVGMAYCGLARWPGYHVWETWGRAEGLASESVWALKYDERGTLWAATNRGLHRFVNRKWERWPTQGIPSSQGMWLAFGPGKTIWVGSYPNGLYQIDGASGAVRAWGASTGLENSWISGLLRDAEGRLWVSTYRGLFRSTGSGSGMRFERQVPPGSAPEETYHECVLDRRGRVWVPGNHGLSVYDHGVWRRLAQQEGVEVRALAEAPDGAVWAASGRAGGLYRWTLDGDRAQVERVDKGERLRSNVIYSLGFDHGGALWVGTDNGFDVKRGENWRHYSRSDGLVWNDANLNSFAADPAGGVWLGTARGLSHFLGTESGRESVPPPVVLSDVRFGSEPAPAGGVVEIPYCRRSFHAFFAALTFQDERETQFRYRLAGSDKNWVTTASRELHISSLPPGDYQFELLARSARGVWSTIPARLRFRILPPWYLQWWCLPVALVLLGLLLWAGYRWRVRRLLRKQRDLEVVVSRRTAELQKAKIRAEEANRLKSEFLATMSHEIRTPIHGVLGMTEVVLGTELNEDQREGLESVRASGHALLRLLSDILDLSRMESGRLTLEAAPFSLHDALRDALGAAGADASEKGLELSAHVASNVPDHLVGDRTRLRQVLVSLLDNGLKFTSRGHVRLEVTNEAGAGEDVQLRFTVADTGIGIPAEHQPHIFDLFRQGDGSITRRFGGTGLGLTLSTRLVALMGGRLWVESEPGRGSRFHFTARFRPSPEPVVMTPAPRSVDAVRRDGPCTILLVEDNRVNQRIAIRLLEKRGYTVVVANNGVEAVEEFGRRDFDLILMDIQMPEMDGLAATAAIRAKESGHIPIIAMTAFAMTGDREKCIEAGMDDYLSKPINSSDLFAKIENYTQAGRLAS